jgi:hypothetical protein
MSSACGAKDKILKSTINKKEANNTETNWQRKGQESSKETPPISKTMGQVPPHSHNFQQSKNIRQSTNFHQKKGRKKKDNLPPRKLSPEKCFQKNTKQKNPHHLRSNWIPSLEANEVPLHCLSLAIQSRFVGGTGPMMPPAKNVRLWIGSPGIMTLANTTTRSGASAYHPELAVNGRRW